VNPGTFERIMNSVERAERHDQRMEWADFALRFFGMLCGLGSASILALLAKYYIDHGAASQGAGIFGAGTASVVGVFVAERFRRRATRT